ncbi:MAG: hypothetical protein ACLQI7_06920 [Streptosporangiaceae bacterium]
MRFHAQPGRSPAPPALTRPSVARNLPAVPLACGGPAVPSAVAARPVGRCPVLTVW